MGEEIVELTLDKEVLEQATLIFEQAGLTIELAINLFLKKVVETKGIEFLYVIEKQLSDEASNTLDVFFDNYNGNYQCNEEDIGEPIGNEIWQE